MTKEDVLEVLDQCEYELMDGIGMRYHARNFSLEEYETIKGVCEYIREAIKGVCEYIREAVERADVEPVRQTSEWKFDQISADWVCMDCLEHSIEHTAYCGHCGARMANYCGARMDGEHE